MMRTVDLYCGAGGLSLGLRKERFELVGAYDRWEPALDTYRRNLGAHACQMDLDDTDTVIAQLKRLRPDVVAGSPPCQEFSPAGTRCEGLLAAHTVNFVAIATALKPEWILMENVDATANSDAFTMSTYMLAKNGYGISCAILNAALCGAPQSRRRLFVVARLGAKDDLVTERLLTSGAGAPMTLRAYFGDTLGLEHYYVHARGTDRRCIHSIDEPAPTIRGTHRNLPQGYRRHRNDSAAPDGIRALTQAERSLIQTFPADWIWLGTKGEIDQMIGNAVPPAMAAYVGSIILE